MECPICANTFPLSVIEQHASKCLFFNESESRIKNKNSNASSSSLKLDNDTNLSMQSFGNKRKSSCKSNINEDKSICDNFSNNEIEINPKRLCLNKHIPLAERMRPTTLTKYVGQTHILAPQTVLFELLEKQQIPNIILWGPPGCGKTSLANVIENTCKNKTNGKMRYIKLSAAMAGINEVKEIIKIATNELKFGRRTVMFMDEIHRFNKSQQDVFLPHIESGTITLIGATTENPSFSLNNALLSRCRLFVLEKLSVEDLKTILKQAVLSLNGIIFTSEMFSNEEITNISENCNTETSTKLEISKFIIDDATIQWLAETSDGDARIALGGLELAIQSKLPKETKASQMKPIYLSLNDIKDNLQKSHMLYDRKGDQHYDTISALHKSVRASDENASVYWLTRMISGGEDPMYISRRLVRMACEDIGLEDPKALGIAVNTMQACKMIGSPDCNVLLAQCTIYLARAPKSRLMEDALRAAQKVVTNQKGPQPSVPLHLRNAPTKLMENLGYGDGYNMRHKDNSGINYLPDNLKDMDFFS